MLATEQVRIFLQLSSAVEPPYRGGILLPRQPHVQVVFYIFFTLLKQGVLGFGIRTKRQARVDTPPPELRMCPEGFQVKRSPACKGGGSEFSGAGRVGPWNAGLILLWIGIYLAATPGLNAREKAALQYGAGLIVNVPFPESEVVQVVEDVVQNGIIRGTKEYNKDEYVGNATAEASTRAFPAWTGDGKAFYKVKAHALDPRNFKDSGDVGTLAVRYVVQAQGDKNSVLRIDAIFVEDFRHTSHLSNGSVESAEYKDIHDRLDAITVMKTETAEAERQREEKLTQQFAPAETTRAATPPPPPTPAESAGNSGSAPQATLAQAVPQTLEERVKDLRRQVQRRVKAPGAPLKSAPFHTASTLQSLPAGIEVLIVISTTYWFGVETHDGQHGWILRDELEQLP